MARVTYVKKAQQRYATVPVLNDDGTQKVVPVLKRDGTPKTTKTGREITRRITVEDKSQPLPPRTCEVDRSHVIEVGMPYKWVKPKSGPYGGRMRVRCASCPTWQPWDLSSSWSVRAQQVTSGFSLDGCETVEDVEAALQNLAEEIRSLAEDSRETAENVREGFGHDTFVSEEADSRADELEAWAEEVEGVLVPDLPEPEEEDCLSCNGSGQVENPDYDDVEEAQAIERGESYDVEDQIDCEECDGTGQVTPDTPTDEQMQDWFAEVESEVMSAVDNCPI